MSGGVPSAWVETFTPFGLFHGVCVVVGATAIAVPIALGVRWRGGRREDVLRAWLGWSTLVAQAAFLVYYMRPSRFVLSESLPLHVCDLAGWIGGAALVTQKRWLRSLSYYWGVGLCTQAFFTPVITQGLGHVKFWLYWMNHIQIVGCAAYDLFVRGYRPGWADYRKVAFQTFLYTIVLMVPFNWWLGTNYAYTGPSGTGPTTILDALGPWPRRLLLIMPLALLVLASITWPWVAWASWRRKRSERAASKQP